MRLPFSLIKFIFANWLDLMWYICVWPCCKWRYMALTWQGCIVSWVDCVLTLKALSFRVFIHLRVPTIAAMLVNALLASPSWNSASSMHKSQTVPVYFCLYTLQWSLTPRIYIHYTYINTISRVAILKFCLNRDTSAFLKYGKCPVK